MSMLQTLPSLLRSASLSIAAEPLVFLDISLNYMRGTIVVPTREIAAKDRNNFLLLGAQSSSHGRFVGTGPQRGRPLEDAQT